MGEAVSRHATASPSISSQPPLWTPHLVGWEVPFETIIPPIWTKLCTTPFHHYWVSTHHFEPLWACHGDFLLCSSWPWWPWHAPWWNVSHSKNSPTSAPKGSGLEGRIEMGGSIEDPLRGFCPPHTSPWTASPSRQARWNWLAHMLDVCYIGGGRWPLDGVRMVHRRQGGEFLTGQLMISLTAIAGNADDPLTHLTAVI